MKKQNGFTLVELLAIIIILGIIVAMISSTYNTITIKAKKDAYKDTLNGLVKAIEVYVAENNDTNFEKDYVSIKTITIDTTNINTIKSGFFIVADGKIILKNVYNGSYCGNGKKGNFIVNEGIC